jgi:hypothetical protein
MNPQGDCGLSSHGRRRGQIWLTTVVPDVDLAELVLALHFL